MSKTILIVDDDKLIREGLSMVLASAGHTVHEASNVKEGFAKAKELHPDIVLTDLRMPVMDGHEMVEKIRKDKEWGKNVPILIMTADDSTSSINTALQSGVTVYLSKANLDPESLSDQILAAIGSS
jgi:CheY-like chemotaxis protein